MPICRLRRQEGNMVMQSLAGLPAFLTYFCVSIVACIVYLFVYTRITSHDEFKLLEQNVPGAAIALGLSLLGFAIPLASAIAHSASVLDCAIWAVIALVIQIVVYFIVRIPVSNFSQRMEQGEMAPAIWLGLASLSAGVLNAACMTY
jgi:putative membrane protein